MSKTMNMDEKRAVFDELSNQLQNEKAQPSRSDDLNAYFIFPETDFLTKKRQERRVSKDKLSNYAELVREGYGRRQLWKKYPDGKWVRDPGKVMFWEGGQEPQPFIRRTELAHRSALAEFQFSARSSALWSVSVAIEPIVCTNENSEAAALLWRAFRGQLPTGYEFKLRRELLNTLVLGGEYEGCDFEVRFVRSKSKIRLSAKLERKPCSPLQQHMGIHSENRLR